MKRLTLTTLLLGLLSAFALGQAARFDSTAQTTTTVSATNTTVLVPLPGAIVTVCSYPSNGTLPCTNKASVCPDATLVGCTSSAPNNPITADSLGNFGFWAPGGSYDYTVCAASGVCQGPYHAVLGQPNGTNSAYTVDGVSYTTIQAAINAAGTTGYVIIPSSYAGIDTYTNTNGIQINDRRRTPAGAPSRYRGFINVLTDCGLKGDGTTDDATAAQACFTAYPGSWFFFPMTKSGGACSYLFGSTVFTHGEGTRVSGESAGFKNSNTTLGGTVICASAGVTPFWSDMTPNSTSGTTFENFSIKGSEGTDHLQTPTKLNIPSGTNLPVYTRSIATAQRTSNVLTITTTAIGNEALTQQVGSTVKIAGTSDATVNGECVIATLTGTNTFSENATGFTCPQNGADTAALGAGGTVSLPTTGTSTADGIRICSNFNTISNVTIDSMGRHAVNADMQSGHGCTTNFADDLIIEKSNFVGNQGDGIYFQGIDSNAGTMNINTIYYNLLWGARDNSSLGNNWFGNQISNNGSQWATSSTPATKAITSISRTLGTADSVVSVVLTTADANIKVGSCIVIAGVTDSSFNTTAGQCFFVTTSTDTTHYTYIQPGAPANASSSGGTSRMAKFSEAYLSAGIDSGAIEAGLQSQVQSQPWMGNYVEGGQICKFGTTLVSIGGANMPTCASLNTFKPVSILGTTPGTVASSTSIGGFANEKDQNNAVFFKAGKSAGTVRHTLFRWWNNNLDTDSWGLDVDPSGAAGTTGSWIFGRGTAGSTIRRLSFFGATNASGITRISSESTGAVQINLDTNSGTGGLLVASGGASPSTVATIDSTGLGTFVGVKSSGAISPTVAGAQTAGTNALPFSSVFIGAAATNNAQLTGTFAGARVQTLQDATGTVPLIIASGTSTLGNSSIAAVTCNSAVTTTATNALTTDSISWAFASAPSGTTDGKLVLNPYLTAGNVNWVLCNPTAGALVPTGLVVNWRVIR